MIINKLPIQIKTSTEPITQKDFRSVQNSGDGYWVKPKHKTGMWTSSYQRKIVSSWVDWCRGENFGNIDNIGWYKLYPEKDLKVFQINSIVDCIELDKLGLLCKPNKEFSFLNHCIINFEKMTSLGYDAINLTDNGQYETRFDDRYSLYGWDCESTVWFQWRFKKVICIKEPTTIIL